MKFDVVLGNPPFSEAGNKSGKRGRAKNLYDKFYKLSISISNCVAMVMPNTSKQISNHNDLIQKTANDIITIPSNVFPTVSIPIWCVIKNNSGRKPNVVWKTKTLPTQKVNWAKGKLNVTNDAKALLDNTINGKTTIIHKITGSGLITYKNDYPVKNKCLFPIDGYVVIMPQQIQKSGWTKTEILKCDGRIAAMNGVTLAFVKTLKEAERLVEYMKTEEFISQALNHAGGMNNMTIQALKSIDMVNF